MKYDRQRTLVIRIAAITLASDSGITIGRFCPSKITGKKAFLSGSRCRSHAVKKGHAKHSSVADHEDGQAFSSCRARSEC